MGKVQSDKVKEVKFFLWGVRMLPEGATTG